MVAMSLFDQPLTAQTWTGSEDTVSRLTTDVASAMALGVEIFLVHEVPGDDSFADHADNIRPSG